MDYGVVRRGGLFSARPLTNAAREDPGLLDPWRTLRDARLARRTRTGARAGYLNSCKGALRTEFWLARAVPFESRRTVLIFRARVRASMLLCTVASSEFGFGLEPEHLTSLHLWGDLFVVSTSVIQ